MDVAKHDARNLDAKPSVKSMLDRHNPYYANNERVMANPHNLTTIQVGEVRNPKGRGKGVKNRGTIIKKWLHAKSEGKNPITGNSDNLTQEDWMVIGMIGAARRGNVRAFEILMDGKYGPLLKLLNPGSELPDQGSSGAGGDSFTSFEVVDPKFNDVTELEIGAGY